MDILTCVLCAYLTGGLGQQTGHELNHDEMRYYQTEDIGNKYGPLIGELELTVQKGYFYIAAKHISGINTEEKDFGLNAIMTGATGSLGNMTVKGGIGSQAQLENPTNDYGRVITELSAMYEFGGLYAKASLIDDMKFVSFGFINRF